ncbi:MAG TPA: hypothetical protein VFI17_04730 [Solirubrobacterales bacterium]|nr:hypothetical protein [Solirubrobacterales bacterium]
MPTDQVDFQRDITTLTRAVEDMATAPPAEAAAARERALDLLKDFREKYDDVDVRAMPPVGVACTTAEGKVETRLFTSFDPGFDWSRALTLINELEMLAEEAREWWPRPAEETQTTGLPLLERLVQRVLSPVARAQRVDEERRPHTNAAFSLVTWVIKAIIEESKRQSDGTDPTPSPLFEGKLDQVQHELSLARARLAQAIQRSAQTRYWYGALLGAAFLALTCVVLAVIFAITGTPAFYGVAVPAGGVGAMVSLLQRMSTGRLQLDTTASRDLLELFGGVRPLIGAVFGIIVAAAIQGGMLPAIDIPAGQDLAFFAVIGFLAGFNERWAQDMLKASGDNLQPGARSGSDAPPAPAGGLRASG